MCYLFRKKTLEKKKKKTSFSDGMKSVSKVLKLLSAATIVAGSNSFVLADCGLCEEKDHDSNACPYFDYKGYAWQMWGNKNAEVANPSTPGGRIFIARSAMSPDNEKIAKPFLRKNGESVTTTETQENRESRLAPKIGETGNIAKKVEFFENAGKRRVATENERREAANRLASENKEPGVVAENVKFYEEAEGRAARESAEIETGEAMEKLFDVNAAQRELAHREAAARAQRREEDHKELASMVADRVKSDRATDRKERARLAQERAEIVTGKAMEKLFDVNAAQQELAHREAAANRIQKAFRSQLERREEAARAQRREEDHKELASMVADRVNQSREEKRDARNKRTESLEKERVAQEEKQAEWSRLVAERLNGNSESRNTETPRVTQTEESQGGSTLKDADASATKIQSLVRGRLARKRAARLQQDNSDLQFAKRLQAEEQAAFDARKRQIAADQEIAENLQHEQEKEATPNHWNRAIAELELSGGHQASQQAAQNHQVDAGSDTEIEADNWRIPPCVKDAFRRYDHEDDRLRAERWARWIRPLSIRKLEAMLWLTSVVYEQNLNEGYRSEEQMAKAVTAVDGLFPYDGNNAAILNVYNAFEHTETGEFNGGLEDLDLDELNAVLYYISMEYMRRLMDGKMPASDTLVHLAKTAVEYFDGEWEAKDVVPATGASANDRNTGSGNSGASDGIVESESAEEESWSLPEGMYYNFDERSWSKSVQTLGIRRLEAVIQLAATSYVSRLQSEGSCAFTNTARELAEKLRNILNGDRLNARLLNVAKAVTLALDASDQTYDGFKYGLEHLDMKRVEAVIGVFASAYREKLRKGSRPADMAFVRFADEVCKALSLDGCFGGEDDYPVMKFEEFGDEGRSVSVSANAGDSQSRVPAKTNEQIEAPETESWQMPAGIYAAMDTSTGYIQRGFNEYGHRLQDPAGYQNEKKKKKIKAQLRKLTVRQIEAVMEAASYVYVGMAGEKGANAVYRTLLDEASEIVERVKSEANDRLKNVVRAGRLATNLGDFKDDLRSMQIREVNSFFLAVAQVYKGMIKRGAVPADDAFVQAADDILELFMMSADGDEDDENTGDRPNNVLEDNRVMVPAGV